MRPGTVDARLWLASMVLGLLAPAWLAAQGGPTDRQKVDETAATRGRALYAQHCINCHGSTAKGGPNGPDLIRSVAVLRDRLGSHIGPAMRAAPASHPVPLNREQIVDLSHFLHERVEATARTARPLPRSTC